MFFQKPQSQIGFFLSTLTMTATINHGNSGGPLCVQYTNGSYYTAGIYLGGTAQTIVRALDAQVVELLRRGEVSSNGGANATGGGVTWLGAATPLPGVPIGYLVVNINPPGAAAAGAQWQVTGFTNRFAAGDLVAMIAGAYPLQFTYVNGYSEPSPRNIKVISGQTNSIAAEYVPSGPALGYLRVNLSPSYAVSAGGVRREPIYDFVRRNYGPVVRFGQYVIWEHY